MQKILSGEHSYIREVANEYLIKGWHVAKGDGMVVLSSIEYRQDEHRRSQEPTTQFAIYLTVVLEKDEG